jgi:hypothetical protein
MDSLIEALFQAVLCEEEKPLSVRHQQVKDRILEAGSAIRMWMKPKLSDPGNERLLLEFRDRLRQRVERGTTQAAGGTADYLIDVLRILAEIEAENFNQPRRIGNIDGRAALKDEAERAADGRRPNRVHFVPRPRVACGRREGDPNRGHNIRLR